MQNKLNLFGVEEVIQALIYTLSCRTEVYQFELVLDPDVDIFGNKYLGIIIWKEI